MNLQTALLAQSRKLRKLADTIDAFFQDFNNEHKDVAKKIIKRGIKRITKKTRKPMSAKERKAVSKRMKQYWADKRNNK